MQIKALLIGAKESQSNPRWAGAAECEADGFDLCYWGQDETLSHVLATHDPDVIVTFGNPGMVRPELLHQNYDVRRRWISLPENASDEYVGRAILECFMGWMDSRGQPLVSVFTAAFEDFKGLRRAYASLCSQTWKDWEWIIVDDSNDGGVLFALLQGLVGMDYRVKVWRPPQHSGKIGYVKRMACGLCVGDFLAELDHDDELTEGCLEEVVKQFRAHPNAGMVWTDCTEVDLTTMVCHRYPEGWGMGFGSYRNEVYKGVNYLVAQGPELDERTIRHIVGVPNHIRVWRREAYHALGGHNPHLLVCDDYDLIVRTWLRYDVIHSSFFGYIQWRKGGSGSQTFERNKEIQRLTRWLSSCYTSEIDKRAKVLAGRET